MKVLATLIVVLLLSPFSPADGGFLKYNELPDGAMEEEPVWSIDDRLDFTKQTNILIPNHGTVGMWVLDDFGASPDLPLIAVSNVGYFLLFSDLNRNQKAEENEIFRSEPGSHQIKLVRLPMIHHGTLRTFTATVSVYSYRNNPFISVEKIFSRFEGVVEIDGIEYPARMVFRSLYPDDEYINQILIIDTNADGHFCRLEDDWCSAQGPGRLLGKLWTVQTEFTEEGAQVNLQPYQGPVGTWTATGEGIHRVFLEKTDGGRRRPVIRLDEDATQGIDLPAGDYKVQVSLLNIGSGTSHQYLQHDHRRHWRTLDFTLPAGQSLKSYIGGPINAQLTVDPITAYIGIVMMNLRGCFQADGPLEFSPLSFVEGQGYEFTQPLYEITDSSGQVVTSGNFEYG